MFKHANLCLGKINSYTAGSLLDDNLETLSDFPLDK